MAHPSACAEFVREGDTIFVLDTKQNRDYLEATHPDDVEAVDARYSNDIISRRIGTLGPLAIMSVDQYNQRLALVKQTGSALNFFDSPEAASSLTDTELKAAGIYATSGLMDMLVEGKPFVADDGLTKLEPILTA